MAQGPNGLLFIGTRDLGVVYAFDPGKQKVYKIAEGLKMPNGVAYQDGSLYVAEVSRILRYDKIAERLETPPKPEVVKDDYPADTSHGWKFIRFGPDGKLYVPVGAPCNNCESPDIYATITRIAKDGRGFEVVARGVRNTVGFDWDPKTKDLWFTDNGRDWLGDDQPADELNRVTRRGQHFGYPYCHNGTITDPEFGAKRTCSEFKRPEQSLAAHVAALGMRFYASSMFPQEFRGDIFIAEHGSWNRKTKSGYRVTRVKVADGKAAGYEPFAEGWLQDARAWGRPVDIEILPDGSMLVSDDYAGAIYRITYAQKD
jgi:glucose/arabinose dehydrogenase